MTPFERDLFTAVAMWQSYWNTSKTIHINVQTDPSDPVFGGQSVDGTMISHSFPNPNGGGTLQIKELQPAALSLIQGMWTPPSPSAPEVNVFINQKYGASAYCFDTLPTQAHRKCSTYQGHQEDWDVTSVLTHELGHGYGFESRRQAIQSNMQGFGSFPNNTIDTFDFYTNNIKQNNTYSYKFAMNYDNYFRGNKHLIVFSGPKTQAFLKTQNYRMPANGIGWPTNNRTQNTDTTSDTQTYGAPLCNLPNPCPACTRGSNIGDQNFRHLSTNPNEKPPSNVVTEDLMSLWSLWYSGRLDISTLDLKIMADMGYPLKTETETPNIRAVLFNNTALNIAESQLEKARRHSKHHT